jgi:hypothetical protein
VTRGSRRPAPPRPPGGTPLFAKRWVHAFEEDTPAGAVYRPNRVDLPLSRRPRERFELCADGSASVFLAGPDDRALAKAAAWKREGEEIAVYLDGGGPVPVLRIVEQAEDRLVVRR